MNPFDVIKSELASLEGKFKSQIAAVEKELHIKLLREGVEDLLSRLATLDPDHSAAYLQAIKDLG